MPLPVLGPRQRYPNRYRVPSGSPRTDDIAHIWHEWMLSQCSPKRIWDGQLHGNHRTAGCFTTPNRSSVEVHQATPKTVGNTFTLDR